MFGDPVVLLVCEFSCFRALECLRARDVLNCLHLYHHTTTRWSLRGDREGAVDHLAIQHASAFTADLAEFNGSPGPSADPLPVRLVRVIGIATARLPHANHISTVDNGSCGVQAGLIL